MAKEIVLNFKIKETGESVEQTIKSVDQMKETLKALQSQMDATEFGTEDYNALAEAIDSVNEQYREMTKSTTETSTSISALNKQIKAAKSDLANFKIGTKEYTEASKKLNELKEKLGDVGDAAKITGNGVERVDGSFKLFREALTSGDIGKGKIAFQALGAAVKAIPLFLIIEGVRFLIEKFSELKNSTGLLGTVFRAIGEAIEWVTDKVKEFTDWIGLTNNKLEETTEKQKKAAQEQRKALEGRYDREIELAKAAGKDVAELEKQKAQAAIAALKVELDGIIALRKARGEYTEEEVARIKEISEEVANIQNKAKATEIAEDKKKTDKKIELNKEYAKNQQDIIKTLKQLQADSIIDQETKEKAALNAKFDNLKKEFIQKKATKAQLTELEEDHQKEITKLNEKYIQIRLADDQKYLDELNKIFENKESEKAYAAARKRENDIDRDAYLKNLSNQIEILEKEKQYRIDNNIAITKLDDDATKTKLQNLDNELASIQRNYRLNGEYSKEEIKRIDEINVAKAKLQNTSKLDEAITTRRIELLSFQAEKEMSIIDEGINELKRAQQEKIDIEKEKGFKLLIEEAKLNDKIALEDDDLKRSQLEKELELVQAKKVAQAQIVSNVEANNGDIVKAEERANQEKLNIQLKYQQDVKKINADITKDTEEQAKLRTQKIVSETAQIVNAFAQVATTIVGIFQELENQEEYKRALAQRKLEEDLDTSLEKIQDKRDEDLYNLNNHNAQVIASNKASLDEQLSNENLTEEEKNAIKEASAAKEAQIKIDFENQKAQIQYEADMAEYQAKLAQFEAEEELKHQAFENDKKFKAAQIVINTITGAMAAYQSMVGIPYVGPVLAVIAAAAVAAMGATQLASLEATRYQKGTAPKAPKPPRPQIGTGASGGGASSAKPTTPKDTTLYGTGGNEGKPKEPQQTVKLEQDQPIRAYVVTSDIEGALDKEAALKRKATGF